MRSPIGGFNEDEYIHIRTDFGGEEFIDRLTEASFKAFKTARIMRNTAARQIISWEMLTDGMK